MKKVKFVYFYFIVLFLITLGYFIDNPFKEIGIYNKLDEYFGLTLFPTLLFLICYGLIFLKENTVSRKILEIKFYMFFILFFLALYTYIIYKSNLNFSSIEQIKNIKLDKFYFKELINICIYKYKIGYFPTYLLYLLLNLKYEFFYIFLAILLTQIAILFFILYSPVKNYFKTKLKLYREKKQLEEEEKLLHEQIKIKEYLEKNQTIKRMKFKENEERIIKEKVEIFKKETRLTKTVNIENNEE